MAFLFAAPTPEAVVHRDEDYLSAGRTTQSRRMNKVVTHDGTRRSLDMQTQDPAQDTATAAAILRRNVVFPDPLAFR